MEALTFGQIIAARRRELKKTQEDVSKAIGTSISAVGLWECGYNFPSSENFQHLAGALNWSVRELVSRTGIDVSELRGSPDKVTPSITLTPVEKIKVQTGNLKAYTLSGEPTFNNAPVGGSNKSWSAVVVTDEDADTVSLEWMEALIETHDGFATINLNRALQYLREHHPSWIISTEGSTLINPELR
jgi:transcriptional regulator with XRE-family HTH domain